jgi:NADPH2:quinone reductase
VHDFDLGDEVYDTPKNFGGPGSYAEQYLADLATGHEPIEANSSERARRLPQDAGVNQ